MLKSQRTREWIKSALQPALDVLGTTSSAYVEVKSQLNDMSRDLISFSSPPAGPKDERLRTFVSSLRPMTGDGLNLQRIGRDGDGGYVMADSQPPSWAVSLGVGTDVSWDLSVSRLGGRVALFDPTIRRLPQPVPGGRFFRLGLGSGADPQYVPLEDLMRHAGMPRTGSGWLKMDVEGAEWTSLSAEDSAILESFDQMVFEFHNLSDLARTENAERMIALAKALTHSHQPVHMHANNFSRLARYDNYWFPDAIEVSFVHNRILNEPKPATSMNEDMNRACDPRVADIDLRGVLTLPA